MDRAHGKTCLKSELARELVNFRISVSPLTPEFQIKDMMSEIIDCQVVKQNNRRQVYHLRTTAGGYFLKRSSLIRTKDRLRHFFLPRRRWAEWRNLHRLRNACIPAAKPMARGQSKISRRKSYFVLTEQVPGTHLPINSYTNARNLGQYLAFLHRRRIYHTDLNRNNFILNPEGQYYLLDAQQVYFLPWMPRKLRINNLGLIIFNLCLLDDPVPWVAKFLEGYNQSLSLSANISEVIEAAQRHQYRRFRSRSKRCCKNSTRFEIIKNQHLHGYRRRDFHWGARELQQAEKNGKPLKGVHVLSHQGVCIKKQRRKFFHQNRCLASWKMSQALEVRGIPVPRSLGYYKIKDHCYFMADMLDDSLHLNTYLSAITDEVVKRRELKKLALWVKKFHDTDIWQRDFKSSNILCWRGQYYMVDLEGVRIRRLTDRDRITNLAQLNASLSNAITIKDRLRFFEYYCADERSSRHQRRKVYKGIWDITKTKGTTDYGLDLDRFYMCN
jgi:tRNA A-37 threonylcarbamoyl transferase component Bud32